MATNGTDRVVGRMVHAAEAFLATLDDAQRAMVSATLGAPDFQEWSYLPGPRPGLPLAELDPRQHAAALELLDAGCSASGAATARGVIELDLIRRQLAGATPDPGDDRFWFRIFDSPSQDGAWAWRVNGHHLAVHLTVAAGSVTVTPSFFGAEPATVPRGPHQGLRVLRQEEDLARELVASLDGSRRQEAITSDTAPDDILTRHDPVADASRIDRGLAHAAMTGQQQALVERLVRLYFDRAPEPAAAAAWSCAEEAGLGQIRFGWAGGTHPGQGHYYSLLGPTFLIEYDNTRDGANHIHSVWRDLRDDWGEDLLARHYAAAHR